MLRKYIWLIRVFKNSWCNFKFFKTILTKLGVENANLTEKEQKTTKENEWKKQVVLEKKFIISISEWFIYIWYKKKGPVYCVCGTGRGVPHTSISKLSAATTILLNRHNNYVQLSSLSFHWILDIDRLRLIDVERITPVSFRLR